MDGNSHESKAKLIKMLKELGVPHYDNGGIVNAQPQEPVANPQHPTAQVGGTNPTMSGNPQDVFHGAQGIANDPMTGMSNMADPMSSINSGGAALQGLASAMTTKNDYQAGLAPTQQMNYGNLISQSGGNALAGQQNFGNIQGQQQQLANQYGQMAAGQGPNPAQAALAQSTGQNVQQQAALMGGQRGAGANAGMMARQIGQAGAGVQQQGVGQAATLQAQQQQAAMQQQASLFGSMGQQNIGQQQAQTGIMNVGAQAQNAQNANQVQNYNMMQGINSTIAQNNANATNQMLGGMFSGFGLTSSLAEGGEVGAANPVVPDPSKEEPEEDKDEKKSNPVSSPGFSMESSSGAMPGAPPGLATVPQASMKQVGGSGGGGGMGSLMSLAALAEGGPVSFAGKHFANHRSQTNHKIDAMVSPGEIYLNPAQAQAAAVGKSSAKRVLPEAKRVPGRAQVSGNSYANDTVPAKLDKGGVVIPRDVAKSKNLPADAARFVAAALAKKGKKK